MTLFEALVLGLIQGLTEFLPISSSAHVQIAQELMGLSELTKPQLTAFIATIPIIDSSPNERIHFSIMATIT